MINESLVKAIPEEVLEDIIFSVVQNIQNDINKSRQELKTIPRSMMPEAYGIKRAYINQLIDVVIKLYDRHSDPVECFMKVDDYISFEKQVAEVGSGTHKALVQADALINGMLYVKFLQCTGNKQEVV